MIMLFMVMMLSRLYITEDLPGAIMDAMMSSTSNKYVVLLFVNLFMIIMGMLMDDASSTLLSVPILLPIVKAVGVSPVHFAAIVAVNISLGCVTPPCAPLLYLGARLSGAEVSSTLKPTFWLILTVWIPALLLVTYIPAISTTLPALLSAH